MPSFLFVDFAKQISFIEAPSGYSFRTGFESSFPRGPRESSKVVTKKSLFLGPVVFFLSPGPTYPSLPPSAIYQRNEEFFFS